MIKHTLWIFLIIMLSACATSPLEVDDDGEPVEYSPKASEINTDLALAYMREGRLALASKKLSKAVRQNPNSLRAHASMGILYQRLKENDKAEAFFEKAISINAKDSTTLNNYALFLCSVEKYEKADAMFNRSVADPLYKTPEIPMTNAGTCALKAGNTDEADRYFRRALLANKDFAPALIKMAELQLKLDRTPIAASYLDRYMAVGQRTPDAMLIGLKISLKNKNELEARRFYGVLTREFPDSYQTAEALKAWEDDKQNKR